MKRKIIFTLSACLIIFHSSTFAETNLNKKTLIFGLLPSESAVTKFKRYAPLRDYLSKTLHYNIRLETARDFSEFIRRTGARRYDFLETAPHLVPAALDSQYYNVITTITQPLSAQVVVLKSSPYTHIEQLANKVIATPSVKAIITKIGKKTISQAFKNNEQNMPVYQSYRTHNAAYQAVLGSQANAAIISVNVFNQALHKHEPLKSIGQSQLIPNMSILFAKDLGATLQDRLQQQLIKMKDTPAGRQVLKKISYPGYRETDADEFNPLRKYLK
jgi:phosphonate transport system substrate-binding protein